MRAIVENKDRPDHPPRGHLTIICFVCGLLHLLRQRRRREAVESVTAFQNQLLNLHNAGAVGEGSASHWRRREQRRWSAAAWRGGGGRA
jgi:hypothetical protein